MGLGFDFALYHPPLTEHFLLRKGLEEDEKDLDANLSLMLVLQLQVSLKKTFIIDG